MGKHNKLNQYQIDQLKELKLKGKSNAEISEMTGINAITVKSHCSGMHDVPEPLTQNQINDIRKMREEGNILQIIADKYNSSIWRIKAALKKEPSTVNGTEILNYDTYGDAFIYQPKLT